VGLLGKRKRFGGTSTINLEKRKLIMTLETITIEDLNLDGMNEEDLWAFWKKTNSVRPISFARQLFALAPKGYVRATKDLGHYASNKATAMMCRRQGAIQSALQYEGIADRIYAKLPEYSRW
jgi:hypothetical protein